MSLSNETKLKLSIYFKYIRKKNKLTQREFISIDEKTNICSISTYVKVEANQIIKSDQIYLEILQKYKKEINISPEQHIALKNYFKTVAHNIYYLKIDEIKLICTHFIKNNDQTDNIFIEESLWLSKIILESYCELKALDTASLERIRMLYYFYEPEIHDAIQDLIIKYSISAYLPVKDILSIFDDFQLNFDSLLSRICYVTLDFFRHDNLGYITKSSFILENVLADCNYNRAIDILSIIALIYSDIQPNNLNDILNRLTLIIDSHPDEILPNKLTKALYQTVVSNYLIENYTQAIKYIKILLKTPLTRKYNLIYSIYLSSCIELNLAVELEYELNNSNNFKDLIEALTEFIYSKDYIAIEKEIISLIKKYNEFELVKEILIRTLSHTVKQTKNYYKLTRIT